MVERVSRAHERDVQQGPRAHGAASCARAFCCSTALEYKKGERHQRGDHQRGGLEHAAAPRRYIENVCAQIVAVQPDIVITEKGVSDLAQHYLMKANITAFRRP